MILAAGPFIGYFIGSWLDEKLGTGPFLLILLLIMGFAASVKETIKILKRANEESD